MDLKRRISFRRSNGGPTEKNLSPQEEQEKIEEVRKIIGPVASKFPALCSDASLLRYLRARKFHTKKAAKMLKGTMKWRVDYKPELIQWDDVAQEAKFGRLYRANYLDSQGRFVFVIRPAVTKSTNTIVGQIKYLVYCLENAILNTRTNQEQMVWLIDFQGWNASCISLKLTRDTAQILQDHYPERLGLAVFYNPPKVFESFWQMVKPFLEPKTYKKVTFAYPDNPNSRRMMEELFDLNKLETFLGGRNPIGMDYEAYSKRMREDDRRMADFIDAGCSTPFSELNESVLSEENNSEDERSSNEAVALNLGEDEENIVPEQIPFSQDDNKSTKPQSVQKPESSAKQ